MGEFRRGFSSLRNMEPLNSYRPLPARAPPYPRPEAADDRVFAAPPPRTSGRSSMRPRRRAGPATCGALALHS